MRSLVLTHLEDYKRRAPPLSYGKDIYNFTQADFTLEGDRVKTRCLFNFLPVNVVIKLLLCV